jgi:hypothetical protein
MIGSSIAYCVSSAAAQRPRQVAPEVIDELEAAERAYLDVDFERTLEHASAALQAGGHDPDRLGRIYELLGVSAAALGDTEGAREFFERMLAIDPDATLDDTVPPRLRAPYLEARGIISARSDQLDVEVGLDRVRAAVRVALRDPFEMARLIRVHARLEGSAEFTSLESRAQPEVLAPLPGSDSADRVEYWVEVLDAYGNKLTTVGSEFEPRTIGRLAVGGSSSAGPGADTGGSNIFEDPLFWIIAGGVVLVTGGVITGVLVDEASHVPVRTGVSFGLP